MAALPSNVRWPRPNRGIRSWMTAVIATLLASSPGRAADGTWQEVALERAVTITRPASRTSASRSQACR